MIWGVLLGWLVVSSGLALLVGTAIRLCDVRAQRCATWAAEATDLLPAPAA